MKIRTELLKQMVAKATKGASLNKLLPLTNMISICAEDGYLTLTTTDMTNYLYIREPIEDNSEMQVVIGIEKFAKLISRLNSEFVDLQVAEKQFNVITNSGSYGIEIPIDENGQPIKFKDKISTLASELDDSAKSVKLSVVKEVLKTCKPALAVTLETPCYTNYYTADRIVATDTYKIAAIEGTFLDEPALISAETMNLLDVMTDEVIEYTTNGEEMLFRTDNCYVYSMKASGIKDYSFKAINGLIDSEFDFVCKVDKEALLSALDRVALFVGVYDNKAVELTFSEDKIKVTNKASNAQEIVELQEGSEDFTCLIDVEMLISQIKANSADVLEIHYGKENSIKIVDGGVTQVMALLSRE